MTYQMNAEHLESVMLYIQALNDADKSIDNILSDDDEMNRKMGEGHLAVLADPIAVHSDAAGPYAADNPEVIGWIVREDFGWAFTQEKPKS